MYNISKKTLERLKKKYPIGCRVELTHMNDPYNTKLFPGEKGTVRCIDDIGTIHVSWDCGSSLGVIFGEDACRRIVTSEVKCTECQHCTYACIGGYLCEKSGEIVIMDFTPTEHYCEGKDYEDEQIY